jgi:hypothetical protein
MIRISVGVRLREGDARLVAKVAAGEQKVGRDPGVPYLVTKLRADDAVAANRDGVGLGDVLYSTSSVGWCSSEPGGQVLQHMTLLWSAWS